MKKRLSFLAAVVLAVTLFAATAGIGHADEYFIGEVYNLMHFASQGYFVEVQSAGLRTTIQVSEELWNQLDIGDTLKLSGETWSLMRKGPSEGAIGTGEKR